MENVSTNTYVVSKTYLVRHYWKLSCPGGRTSKSRDCHVPPLPARKSGPGKNDVTFSRAPLASEARQEPVTARHRRESGSYKTTPLPLISSESLHIRIHPRFN
jgi:hypothetical protein